MRSEERGHEQKIGEDDRRRRRGRASIENTHRVKRRGAEGDETRQDER